MIRKEHYNAFHETALDSELRERGVDVVVVAGWDSDVCCSGSARGAFERDYRVVFLSDATGTDGGEAAHAATLANMHRVVADVMTAKDFRASLQRTLGSAAAGS